MLSFELRTLFAGMCIVYSPPYKKTHLVQASSYMCMSNTTVLPSAAYHHCTCTRESTDLATACRRPNSSHYMSTASFSLWASLLVAVLLLLNLVDASSRTRKLLTGNKHLHIHIRSLLAVFQPKPPRHKTLCFMLVAPEVPVVDTTCALSTVEGDTVTFSNPE